MAQTIIGGWGAYANYGYETTYGTVAASAPRVFGPGQKLTINRKNNMEPIYGLGSRNASTLVAKKYEGTASVEFLLANGSFFRGVLGTVTDGGSAPYTHTYAEANTLPGISILTGSELGTTDEVVALVGCVVKTCTLTAAVDEVAKVKLDLFYKTETLATSGIGSQVAETFEPFVFSHGTLEIPNSTAISYVQSFELTVDNSSELIWSLGARVGTAQVSKARKYTFKLNVAYSDPTIFLQKFLGASAAPDTDTPAAQATLELTFTNGLTGSDQRSIVILLTNVYFDTYDMNKDVNEVLKEDMSGYALGCTSVVWSNNTASDDDLP
jgi:hypothetical protein